MSLLDIADLHVSFGNIPVVEGVDLRLEPGEILAIVGESGSGKSVTARSIIGLAGDRSRVRAERLRVAGEEVSRLGSRGLRRLRGGTVGLVAQDAFAGLDPLRPVGREIEDGLRLHRDLSPAQRRDRVIELLERVHLPDPEVRAAQLPGQLSGGQRQRALIAAALAGEPALLIADEPTTALDATIQAGILELLREIADAGTGILLISHDLAVVSQLAGRIAVMHAGRIVETGPTAEIISRPSQEYTRMLLAANPTEVPRGTRLLGPAPSADPVAGDRPGAVTRGATAPETDEAPVLSATGLSLSFPLPGGARVQAVDEVSLRLSPGRTLGIVGESGSGKSTVARILLGLQEPQAGTVELAGTPWVPGSERERRPLRGHIGAISQDPFGALDPRWTIGRTLSEALGGRPAEVAGLLERVRLAPEIASRRPRGLSPGQRQRIAIARAVARAPEVLIADEPVSSLDVSVQAQVLDLLDDLQEQMGLALVLISHDLGVIRHAADDVLVMRAGRIVESGPTETVFSHPRHDVSRALVRAAPRLRD